MTAFYVHLSCPLLFCPGPYLSQLIPEMAGWLSCLSEVILGMPWDSKIDIWSIGMMVCVRVNLTKQHIADQVAQIWDLFEGGRLFYAVKGGSLNDEQHLAEMVSLMGPPPREFLERSEKCGQYWDSEGEFLRIYRFLSFTG